jgi:hypothetical protein
VVHVQLPHLRRAPVRPGPIAGWRWNLGALALLQSLPDVFPWVRFLPTEDVRAFLVELVETIRACADLSNVAAIAPVIAAWRGTAEIYSDPELLKAAMMPLDGIDYGDVPEDC